MRIPGIHVRQCSSLQLDLNLGLVPKSFHSSARWIANNPNRIMFSHDMKTLELTSMYSFQGGGISGFRLRIPSQVWNNVILIFGVYKLYPLNF